MFRNTKTKLQKTTIQRTRYTVLNNTQSIYNKGLPVVVVKNNLASVRIKTNNKNHNKEKGFVLISALILTSLLWLLIMGAVNIIYFSTQARQAEKLCYEEVILSQKKLIPHLEGLLKTNKQVHTLRKLQRIRNTLGPFAFKASRILTAKIRVLRLMIIAQQKYLLERARIQSFRSSLLLKRRIRSKTKVKFFNLTGYTQALALKKDRSRLPALFSVPLDFYKKQEKGIAFTITTQSIFFEKYLDKRIPKKIVCYASLKKKGDSWVPSIQKAI